MWTLWWWWNARGATRTNMNEHSSFRNESFSGAEFRSLVKLSDTMFSHCFKIKRNELFFQCYLFCSINKLHPKYMIEPCWTDLAYYVFCYISHYRKSLDQSKKNFKKSHKWTVWCRRLPEIGKANQSRVIWSVQIRKTCTKNQFSSLFYFHIIPGVNWLIWIWNLRFYASIHE